MIIITNNKNAIQKGLDYEKKKAKAHRGKHVGGPGKEDYSRGETKGEIKHRKTKVTKPELKKIFKKGISEVESISGYTKPALEYKKKYHPEKKLYTKSGLVN